MRIRKALTLGVLVSAPISFALATLGVPKVVGMLLLLIVPFSTPLVFEQLIALLLVIGFLAAIYLAEHRSILPF